VASVIGFLFCAVTPERETALGAQQMKASSSEHNALS
jgi:hypothetical protein